ncbi:MAG: helix-turn-helix domain-containing protein [Desulfobulbaceae bacterium]|uniref:Helix-turn-helix domain-containing protein n=1 Tax=Candidatus Desulfobia pelagia TaxID=2841692 RepID=A0A8J6TFV4_9BACT|nr:helix-turn-helix domain-containing protein [Candidatus Desulfobia pelagia]
MVKNISGDGSASSSHANATVAVDNSLGSILRKEREKQNISLEEVAESTCIHIATLRAIETGDRDRMPAEVFSRGFVKLYAEYLGLDSQDIINCYNNEMVALGEYGSENKDSANNSRFLGQGPFFTLPKIILMIFIFIVIALGYLYCWAGNDDFPFPRQSRNVYFEKYYLDHDSPLSSAKTNADIQGGVITSTH